MLWNPTQAPRPHQRPCAKTLLIGFDIIGAVAHQSVALLQAQGHAQRDRNGLSDVFLDGENPFETLEPGL